MTLLCDHSWFDPETNILRLDEAVSAMPSFKRIMEDGIVTKEELIEQSHLVSQCMKELESALSPEIKPLVTKVICELSVLYMIQKIFTTQKLN